MKTMGQLFGSDMNKNHLKYEKNQKTLVCNVLAEHQSQMTHLKMTLSF